MNYINQYGGGNTVWYIINIILSIASIVIAFIYLHETSNLTLSWILIIVGFVFFLIQHVFMYNNHKASALISSLIQTGLIVTSLLYNYTNDESQTIRIIGAVCAGIGFITSVPITFSQKDSTTDEIVSQDTQETQETQEPVSQIGGGYVSSISLSSSSYF